MTILMVAAGGALGAVARYLLAVRLYAELGLAFPWGTLGVNVLGCALLGVVLGLIEERDAFSPSARTAITVGFLGAMTTFSTFVYEGWQMMRDGDPLRSGSYVVLSLALGFAAFVAAHEATMAAA
ncbi:MAG TPA: fluoride efflux transporter CrcB [Dehalococcoidia bacterium]|nr:fluoride efflux transporter CrcB [Dehalococcoidia bacterium]